MLSGGAVSYLLPAMIGLQSASRESTRISANREIRTQSEFEFALIRAICGRVSFESS
jgi:hypothetical protein